MALTAGLLVFLGVEALFEAFELAADVPGALGGPGLVLLGVAGSFLAMTFISSRFSGSAGECSGRGARHARRDRDRRAQLRRGLAIGTSFAFGQLALGSFLIVGFMVHNVTEGLGIAAPAADEGARISIPSRRARRDRRSACDPRRLARRLRRERRARGALLRRGGRRGVRGGCGGRPLRAPARSGRPAFGLRDRWFLAGIAIMYATGLLVG